MKNITALVTLFCLMGLAGAQGSGLGDGYSSTQRAFFNEPITSTFEPYVNNYWSNYVVGNKSQSGHVMTSEMDMWVNNFPLMFSIPMQLDSTSFKSNVSTQGLGEKEKNSQTLKTAVYRELGLSDLSKLTAAAGSLNATGASTPAINSTGNLLSQSVMSFFNV
ncbi:MAG: hypothetical protein WA141_02750 [Methanothrix sp.]